MQGGRGRGNPFFGFPDPFAHIGGFGGRGSLMPGFFGGRDPFDDPFFTQPFGGVFQSSLFGPTGSSFLNAHAPGFLEHQPSQMASSRGPIIEELSTGSSFMNAHAPGFLEHQPSQMARSKGPIIEELNSDDEKEAPEGKQERKENPRKHGRSGREPYVVDPNDESEERRSKQLHHMNGFSSLSNTPALPQAQSFTYQSSSVTYGGVNGAYYTSSTTKRSGSDGLTFEEHREADSATGQAAHRLSKGIHNKGHTVSRKLNTDGRVDTMQTLHNINEDELSGFEKAWNGKAQKHLPGWSGGANGREGSAGDTRNRLPSRGGWALPATERPNHPGNMKLDMGQHAANFHSQPSGRMGGDAAGETVDSSRGRYGAARTSKTESRKR